jgi:hypothetical protein
MIIEKIINTLINEVINLFVKRDQNLFDFITDFHVATSNQINTLFFNNNPNKRYCNKRLKYLYDNKYIKRTRSTISNDFAYYIDKKSHISQVHHDLIRVELYINIKKHFQVLGWSNELPIKNIRPDAVTYLNDSSFAYINNKGITIPVFIEVHLNNKFNFDKYINLLKQYDLKALFGVMPRVVICTDKQVIIPKDIVLKFKIIDIEMNGIENILK